MTRLSFPPAKRGRDNLTWTRFTAGLLFLGLLLAIIWSTR